MIEYPAQAATPPTYELAEGVIWDDRAGLVRWVDLWEGRVLAGTLTDDTLTVTETIVLGQAAAAVGLARQAVEGEVVVVECDFGELAFRGAVLDRTVGQLQHVALIVEADHRRFRDIGAARRLPPVIGEERGDLAARFSPAHRYRDALGDLGEPVRHQ